MENQAKGIEKNAYSRMKEFQVRLNDNLTEQNERIDLTLERNKLAIADIAEGKLALKTK